VIEQIKPRGITCFGGKLDLKTMSFFEKMIANKFQSPIGDFRNWETIIAWAEAIC
jgi:menaquinone-dependent protoporphyrinogen IX oxidase